VACTPVMTLRSAGSSDSRSAGSAESARPRLSATERISRAKRSTPNLLAFSTSCWARRDIVRIGDRAQVLVLQVGVLGLEAFDHALQGLESGLCVDRHVIRGAARG